MKAPGHAGPPRPKTADVLAGQLEYCYRQFPVSVAVHTVTSLVLAIVLWSAIGPIPILVWLLTLTSLTAVRYIALLGYRNPHRRKLRTDAAWKRDFEVGVCASGVIWGAAGVFLFHPESFPHQVFLAFVLGGMVAGAVPVLSALNHAYQFFAIPIVIPISVEMLAQGDSIHLTMALMIMVFAIAMLASSIQVQHVFRDSVELRLKLLSSIENGALMAQMALMDDLTKIPNRRHFEERLANEWRRAQREGDLLTVITADVDYFKAYNDHYGHPAGDACLASVAGAMAEALHRPGDVAARIGGEEFAFLLPNTSLEGASTIAERIRRNVLDLNLPHETSLISRQVTISLGVASLDPLAGASISDLLRASDVALYESKRQGRNRVTCLPMADAVTQERNVS